MQKKGIDLLYLITGVLCLCLFVIGLLDPIDWWGTHFLAFLPWWLSGLFLLCGAGILLWGAFPAIAKLPSERLSQLKRFDIILVAIVMGVLFILFPIANDIYGDAMIIKQSLDTTYKGIPDAYREGFYAFDFSASSGRRFLIPTFAFLSSLTNHPLRDIFTGTGVVFGMGFVLLWLFFLRNTLAEKAWQWPLTLVALAAPFMLIFYGHMEFYAITFCVQLGWFVLLLHYLKTKHHWLLLGLLPLQLLAIKVHPTSLLLVPACCLALLHTFCSHNGLIKKLLTWKGVLLLIFIPILMAGAVLYFFVFESHVDNRIMEGSTDMDHVFLPLFSPAPPLDRYNLLSWNHFFDFFQSILLWSPAALFVCILVVLKYRKAIPWNSPAILITGFTLLLNTLFLFVINPLMTLPMDWDLFAIPAISFLLLTVSIIAAIKVTPHFRQQAVAGILGLTLLSLPVIAVNASLQPFSKRIENVGIRIFKTYYDWSETTLLTAVAITQGDQLNETYIERKLAITEKLKPYALAGNDSIYGVLLYDNGMYYYDVAKDFEKARQQFQLATIYSPHHQSTRMKLMECQFRLQQYMDAYLTSRELIRLKHPNEEKSLRIGIHCAIEADLRDEAIYHCHEYLDLFPQNTFIQGVHEQLEDSVALDVIRQQFRKG